MKIQDYKKYIPNHKVRNVRNAKIVYSAWGYHIVEFSYQALLNDTFVKMGIENPNKIKISQAEFSDKKTALEFIKKVNNNV